MAYQFTCPCPQQMLLEVDESAAGQVIQCPYCPQTFPAPAAPFGELQPAGAFGDFPAGPEPTGPPLPQGPPGLPDLLGPNPHASLQAVVHIPCPQGHVLEVPREMLEQTAVCPHCNSQFKLAEKKSLEWQKKHEEELSRQEAQAGRTWLNWAIVIATLAVIGLIVLIAATASRS